MDTAVWSTVVTLIGTGFLSTAGLILSGKFIPASRLDKAEAEVEKWKQSFEQMRSAREELSDVVRTQQLTASVTNNVLTTLKQARDGVL